MAIEFTQNNLGIRKPITQSSSIPLSSSCPDRLRGQHCEFSYDIATNAYYIQDLGSGIGSFLKCDATFQKDKEA